MAPEVTNKGVITSKNGATHLAASDAMTLTINQDQTINIKINPSKIKASAGNEGVIISEKWSGKKSGPTWQRMQLLQLSRLLTIKQLVWSQKTE